ncbi:MAG TPA: DUF4253 domain-containing protein, partial [Candidatus Binatia bacterium]|nr:DUF4253 domain-containing protein [Candidatus Binatia bacterium]
MQEFIQRLLGSISVGEGSGDGVGFGDDDPDDDSEGDGPDERVYLEFVGGTSAKFYALVVVQDDNDRWGVAFNFGRIGYPRDWARKAAGMSRAEAQRVYDAALSEKLKGGYTEQPWPDDLALPGARGGAGSRTSGPVDPEFGLFRSTIRGGLPPSAAGIVADVRLPRGELFRLQSIDGESVGAPVLWLSEEPVEHVDATWARLASGFSLTGLWPLVVEPEAVADLSERLFRYPRARPRDAGRILRGMWDEGVVGDDEEFDPESLAPLTKRFPGLAPRTPGEPVASIDDLVLGLTGHLALVAVERPADVMAAIGWSGPANYDFHPQDQSAVLRSWESRFDAYLVMLG